MQDVIAYLDKKGLAYKNFGCHGEKVDYPEYGKKVAHAVAEGECEKGIREVGGESDNNGEVERGGERCLWRS